MLIDQSGKKIIIEGEEFHSNKGVVKIEEGAEGATSHLGHAFHVLEPDCVDLYEKMPRAGSFMLKKDIGLVIAHLGVGSGDRVIDAGTGSAGLAIYLGNVVGPRGRVVSYEKNPEFAGIARRNVLRAGLDETIEIRERDVQQGFDEADGSIDAVVLDLHEAWNVIGAAKGVLKRGSRIGVYNPYMEHARLVHERLLDLGFIEVKTIEASTREIEFRKQGSRPKTSRVGHSGYLTFGRKV